MSEVQSRQGGARVRVPPPLVFVAALLLGGALSYALPLPIPSSRPIQIATGVLVAVLGGALGAAALGLFRKSGQKPQPWEPTPSLLFAGPYQRTRNPMYVGMTSITLGIGLALGTLWIPLLSFVALAVVHYTAVLPEEAYLADKFGQPYLDYKARVRRYL